MCQSYLSAVAPHGSSANRARPFLRSVGAADLRHDPAPAQPRTERPMPSWRAATPSEARGTICRRRRGLSPNDLLPHIVAAPEALLGAHQRSTGRLCVSLTQLRGGRLSPSGLCLKSSRQSLTFSGCTLLAWTLGVECVSTTSGQSSSPLSEVPSPCSSKRGSSLASRCAVTSGVGVLNSSNEDHIED